MTDEMSLAIFQLALDHFGDVKSKDMLLYLDELAEVLNKYADV